MLNNFSKVHTMQNATQNATVTTTTTTANVVLNNLNTNTQSVSVACVNAQVKQQNAQNAHLYTVAQKQLAQQLQTLAINTFCLQKQNALKQCVFINMRKKFICVKVANAVALMQQHSTAYLNLLAFCNANSVTVLTTVNNSLLLRIAQ